MVNLLSPYRVLDLSDETGLIASKVLSDLGAEVLMVEPPAGNPARKIGPFLNDIPGVEHSLFWQAYNTNKKSITLNLEAREGRKFFRALIKTTDFIIESFPPGSMANWGLDYPSLADINNRLIMASVTPFGQTGPYRDFKSSDLVASAMGGLISSIGDADRAPVRFSLEQTWPQAGLQTAMALLIAVNQRNRTGKGQYLDISLQECMSSIVEHRYHYVGYGEEGTEQRRGPRVPRGGGKSAPLHIWHCKDGYICWRIFSAAQGPKTQALVDWMKSEGVNGLLNNVDWQALDFENISQEELDQYEVEFGRFFKIHTKEELQNEAIKRGIMLFPVNTAGEILQDKQLNYRQYWVDNFSSTLGRNLTYPGLPAKLAARSLKIQKSAPRLGEHNHDIYINEMGISKVKFSTLRRSGVI
jgi:crotonobetainyl-CoA:carnitine CoA-transferase CaiB-like acyl-CoA transferase